MEELKKIRTVCRSCHGECGVIAHVKDGKVVKVEGDPNSPISHGTMCAKGLAITQLAYHPDRILHPMKKIGKKLSGKWEQITWDEALDTIAAKFQAVVDEYGPEYIVVGQGTGRDYESHLYRFANQLGTPNVLTAGHFCYVSRVSSSLITCGNLPVVDYYINEPKCIVIWGTNPMWTNPDEYMGENFMRALKNGAKLINVDPRKSFYAGRADLWLQIRPGTDGALAFGFHHVIIEEELYDKDFVENYIHGWNAFKERVMKDYPLEKVQEITWIDKELIREAARMYATTKPAAIQWGVPTEESINCTDFTRTAIGLMGITGNLDAPGGNALFVNPPTRTVAEFSRHKDLSKEVLAKRLGGEQFKLGARVAFINPKKAWDSIVYGEPYQLKAGLLCGTNPVVSRANAREAYEALKKIGFLVVIDHFMTPTAELADIFLPAGTWLEQNHVASNWKRHGYAFARQKCCEIGEAWQDHKIFQELGKRMGQEWWPTVEDGLDYLLEPSGLTFEQFKEKGYLQGEMVYYKYRERGFSTPTRKLELWSTILEKWGRDPLPKYVEVPESPYSTPEVAKKYPYIFNSGLRTPTYFHSAGRMIPLLREIRPDPIVEVHPETAKKHGIEDGQWIYIESPRGRIKQRAKLYDGIDPRVVTAEHGWWFPEIKDPGHGWEISNANILTDNAFETCDPNMGSTNVRVCLCNIYPCENE
ncbi:MAG: molybdopterin-dependent oxidoreductase [Deltaproteobacteria bacterium]|nr:molybdopterin-dependent oxidoreductase [Deltaproteobacteria bacterium]